MLLTSINIGFAERALAGPEDRDLDGVCGRYIEDRRDPLFLDVQGGGDLLDLQKTAGLQNLARRQ